MRIYPLSVQKVDVSTVVYAKSGYILPFENETVDISQGYYGPYSHIATYANGYRDVSVFNDDRFSVDFKLPIGTPVIAAKEGRVISLGNGILECYRGTDIQNGLAYMPNFVLLCHNRNDSNEFTIYSHLQSGSLSVCAGEIVKKGQIIGKTGLSGWIGTFPHLHFEGLSILGSSRYSFPTVFENYSGCLLDSSKAKNLSELERKILMLGGAHAC